MSKKVWTVFGAAAALALGWWAYRRSRSRKYVVITAHGAHSKGEILRFATRAQVEAGAVIPVDPREPLPLQAQVNAQLADATDDLGFQDI